MSFRKVIKDKCSRYFRAFSKKDTMDLSKTALVISYLANAPFVSIPVFILINFVISGARFIQLTVICVLFAGFIPVITILLWSRKTRKIDLDIPEKNDRPLLLASAVVSYLIGSGVLFLLHAPWLVLGLMVCYCTNTLVVLIITLFWKISIHAMGITGPATALAFAAVVPGLILGILVVPVMWSRVFLNRHTIAQVLAGACLGIPLTWLQLLLIQHVYG